MKLFCTAERIKQLHDPHREPTNLAQLGKRSLKDIQGFNRIRNRDLHEYRCDALPTELRNVWSSVRRITHGGGGGGGEATRSGTEKRCSHNLQNGQSAG